MARWSREIPRANLTPSSTIKALRSKRASAAPRHAAMQKTNIVKETHLCCDIVKLFDVLFAHEIQRRSP
jgi:hypothetical protein